ncbi:50S ribosomal protein L6 [Thiomicrospira microaerophila]|uniref:50S ribosomal protein L6 n=1 Tax=Thiomicrospira microaerophila TaxID=406020 RepID=UPI0005CB6E03|nr:50S ribosomal protein L6 [Thiomicrospira microaerophila]
MSRIAKSPVTLPKGVELSINGVDVAVKGPKGSLNCKINTSVKVQNVDGVISFEPAGKAIDGWSQAGTARAIVSNMVTGVSQGFEKKLQLVGVGYRAQVQGNVINLTLGFSHPVAHQLPEGVTAETPTQTEIIIRGADKQAVGQVAAQVRGYRPPEPYKGKGVKYADERILRKEAKKK